MSFMITAECINCSACELECPVRAIQPGPSKYLIDPEVCIECDGYFPEARCKWACPVDACVPERADYLARDNLLASRGAPPIILTPQSPHGAKLTS